MSADNLTGQYISSTFRKILQLSDNGSYITDGTGSVINELPTTASYAITASYALTSAGTVTNAIYAETASYSTTLGASLGGADDTVYLNNSDGTVLSSYQVNNVQNANIASIGNSITTAVTTTDNFYLIGTPFPGASNYQPIYVRDGGKLFYSSSLDTLYTTASHALSSLQAISSSYAITSSYSDTASFTYNSIYSTTATNANNIASYPYTDINPIYGDDPNAINIALIAQNASTVIDPLYRGIYYDGSPNRLKYTPSSNSLSVTSSWAQTASAVVLPVTSPSPTPGALYFDGTNLYIGV